MQIYFQHKHISIITWYAVLNNLYWNQISQDNLQLNTFTFCVKTTLCLHDLTTLKKDLPLY